jgi:hypothetical protein
MTLRLRNLRNRVGSITLIGLALCTPGCVLAGVAGLAVVTSQDFVDHAATIIIEQPSQRVWEATVDVFQDQTSGNVEIDEAMRTAQINSRGTEFTAVVETLDINRTKLILGARRYAVYQRELAEKMGVRIKHRIELVNE